MYSIIMQLCTERGITPGKMCADIGMSRGIVTDLKAGRQTGISTANAQKIASYFGVSVDFLLTGNKNAASASDKQDDLCPMRSRDGMCIPCASCCESVSAESCKALRTAYQIGYEESVCDVANDIVHALLQTMENRIER